MAHKREEIEPKPSGQRYIRRADDGQIGTSADFNRSLLQDDRHNAKRTSEPGQGDGHTGNRELAERGKFAAGEWVAMSAG